jgi:hypothetical protein
MAQVLARPVGTPALPVVLARSLGPRDLPLIPADRQRTRTQGE